MDIIRPLQGTAAPRFSEKYAAKDEEPPVMKDLVTLSGTQRLSSASRASIADQLFKAREALWTSEYQAGSGISKGFFELPGGGLIAGTYCDLAVINAADGKTLWKKDLMEKAVTNLSTSPAIIAKDGSLLIGTTNGTLHSLDPGTGKENWSYSTKAYATMPVQTPYGTIFVQKEKDLVALNPDGTEKFQVPIGRDRQKISYADSQGAVYVQSDDDIFAIGPDGTKRWQVPGKDLVGFSDDQDRLYTTASKDVPHPVHKNSTTFHTLVDARDPQTGAVIWENEYDYARVGGHQKGLLFIYEHTKLSALDAATGKPVWEQPGNMRDIKAVLDDGTLIIGGPGKIESLDAATGKQKWSLDIKSVPGSEAYRTARGSIVVSDYNNIYCVDPDRGNVQMTIKMDKGIRNLTLSKDEAVIYVENMETGAVEAVDFRTNAEYAKDLIENTPPPDEQGSTMEVGDDYIVIDEIKVPVKKDKGGAMKLMTAAQGPGMPTGSGVNERAPKTLSQHIDPETFTPVIFIE